MDADNFPFEYRNGLERQRLSGFRELCMHQRFRSCTQYLKHSLTQPQLKDIDA